MKTHEPCHRLAFTKGTWSRGERDLAAETAIAISYNGSAHAVLMATPDNLDDFAAGFSLSEGIIASVGEIENIEPVEGPLGVDLQVRLRSDVAEKLAARRRSMAGPAGCGLCGIESLEAAMHTIAPVAAGPSITARDIATAVRTLGEGQSLNELTKAVHAAGFFVPGQALGHIREDVGRHNALDKLIGALALAGIDPSSGAMVVTSRISVELVQKCAAARCAILIAISAPTLLAVQTAQQAGITLAAIVRGTEFEIYTGPERIDEGVIADVA